MGLRHLLYHRRVHDSYWTALFLHDAYGAEHLYWICCGSGLGLKYVAKTSREESGSIGCDQCRVKYEQHIRFLYGMFPGVLFLAGPESRTTSRNYVVWRYTD